ncbi:UDP-galactopyranose mutase [Spirochaetia bacterium]|nr:UDP-galactopyranose mutase [Spirochaetia bacterium]
MYDYLIVGSGLSGAVFAHEAIKKGKRCLVLEKRNHIGGNVYCEDVEDIRVHRYGAHIFHTDNESVWRYVTELVPFNHFVNSPVANYRGKLYNLPFNMNTFYQMWGLTSPIEAKARLETETAGYTGKPKNLEEQALSLVGRDLYETLVKGYTEKQWGRPCVELPAFIIKRLPVRFTFDNNYFSNRFQGIPAEGYTALVKKLLKGADIRLNTDFLDDKEEYSALADKIVYTGTIDSYFGYKHGWLEYRSLRFETETLDEENHQGVAVMNYTAAEIPYTRIIEHKHFENGRQAKTVVTREYPEAWQPGLEPYYPVNDEKNNTLYIQYKEDAAKEKNVLFLGRLARYAYYDMDQAIVSVLETAEKELRMGEY